MVHELKYISPDKPVLIAGPTASGKSALALKLLHQQGGVIVNADALQVFENWRILTARPSQEEEAQAPHLLYGHVPGDEAYSVGHWLSDIRPILKGDQRPIIVGGTGLYFTTLTEGLADIPPIPEEIRQRGTKILIEHGIGRLIGELDSATLARIDQQNPMRVQRAWEVLAATGRDLASWQDNTPAPLLPLSQTQTLLLDAPRDWLNQRIERRFQQMLVDGALDEAESNRASWSEQHPSAKAIGAREMMAHLDGKLTLEQASDSITIATRQYAKRQRSWFRARMSQWDTLTLP